MEIKKEDEKRFFDWAESQMENACTSNKIGLRCFPNSLIRRVMMDDFGITRKDLDGVAYFDWGKSKQGKKVVRIINRVLKKHQSKMGSGGEILFIGPPDNPYKKFFEQS